MFLASAAIAWPIAAPASSCGWGWPGRTHSPSSGLGPRARHRGRQQAGQRVGDALLLEFLAGREPHLEPGGGRGDRVRPGDERLRLGSPDSGGGLLGVGRARAVGPGGRRVGQEQPVQVGRDRPGADPGAGVGGEGLPDQARDLNPGDQPPVPGGAVRLVRALAFGLKAPPEVGIDLGARLGAVEGQREGGDRAAVEAGADDRAGVGGGRVQQDGLVPPGVADAVDEALDQVGVGADVPGGQVLLERQVGEGVPALGLGQQAVAGDVVQELLAGDRRGVALQLGPEDLKDAGGGQVARVVAHHLVGERGQQRLLGRPRQELGQVLGLGPAREQDLADLPVEVGPAARQRAPVPVRGGDHRQQQRVDRQVVQRRIGLEQGVEPVGRLPGPELHGAPGGPAGGAGRVPLGGEVPAVEEEPDLLGRERPGHQHVGLDGERAEQVVGPGGDHEVVVGVGRDLPPDPVGHGQAVIGPGDLVQAVEHDQAPAPLQLALPPAAGFSPRPGADRGPDHIGQRDRRIGDDRLGPLPQRQQDGDAPAAGVPAAEVTPHGRRPAAAGGVGQQGALAGAGLSDEGEDHPRAAVEELVDRVPGRAVPSCRAVTRSLLRSPADQRNVNVDVAQFRDVIAAGREILHVDIPERVEYPPPVPEAVPGNGRRLHHVSPPHLRHPALR